MAYPGIDDAEMKEIARFCGQRYVETCPETIELIRRDLEVAKMKAKMMYKGEFGADHNRYIEHLNSQMKADGLLRVATRFALMVQVKPMILFCATQISTSRRALCGHSLSYTKENKQL